MSNFLIFGVFQMTFTQKVLNVIKAGFHRSWLIYIYDFPLDSYRKMNISRFSNGIIFGLAVKNVKVNPDSSFVHTW